MIASIRPGHWLALLLILTVLAAIRSRLFEVPLERDEGEYAYGGWLLLQGVPPYELFYTMKLPGTHAMYALFMALFGQTPQGVRAGLLITDAASVVLLFFLARRLLGSTWSALAAALVYAVMCCHSIVLGQAAHATHFVVLFALGGSVAMARSLDRGGRPGGLLATGLLFGISVLMKQSGALLGVCAGGAIIGHWLAHRTASIGPLVARCAAYSAGAVLPVAMIYAWTLVAGTFEHAWFWTVTYARSYASGMPITTTADAIKGSIDVTFVPAASFWIAAAIGLVSLPFARFLRGGARILLGAATIASAVAVCVGWYFRPHYYVQLLPVAAVLAAVAVQCVWTLLRAWKWKAAMARAGACAALAAALLPTVAWEWRHIWRLTPVQVARFFYYLNPFAESKAIGDYIREHTSPTDTIAVFGSEPQMAFFAQRRSCTGFIYTYGMLEPHAHASQMQRDMMDEVAGARPAMLVIVDVEASWAPRKDTKDLSIISWSRAYAEEHYDLRGVVDLLDPESLFTWDEGLATHVSRSPYQVLVFSRKPGE